VWIRAEPTIVELDLFSLLPAPIVEGPPPTL